jgi:hypothetical protein
MKQEHAETKKLKPKNIEVGNCCCEARAWKHQENRNLSEPNLSWWQRKQDQVPSVSLTTKAGCWNTIGTLTTSIIFTFSQPCNSEAPESINKPSWELYNFARRARSLFLKGETHKGVRLLMRQSSYNSKHKYKLWSPKKHFRVSCTSKYLKRLD